MVSRREEIAYKYPYKYIITPSGEECHLSFYKRENNQCNSYPDRQHNCPLVPSKNGRYDRQDTCRFKQGHLEISDIEADHNYCRIPPRYSEHKSRLVVLSQKGLLVMEVISNSIPTYLPKNGDVSDRSVCFQIIQSNSEIFCLETRPTQFSYACNATRMKPRNSICISPVFVNSKSTLQNSKGESHYSNIDNSSMANSTRVSKSSCKVIFSTFSTPRVSRHSEEPESGRLSLGN